MSEASDSKPPEESAVMPESAVTHVVEADDAVSHETTSDAAAKDNSKHPRSQSGRWIAGLALLLALIALALTAGSLLRLWDPGDDDSVAGVAALQSRLDGVEVSLEQLAGNQTEAAAGAAELRRLEARVAAAEQSAAESDRAVARLQQRIERIQAESDRRSEVIDERLSQVEQRAAAGVAEWEPQLVALIDQRLRSGEPPDARSANRNNAPNDPQHDAEQRALRHLEDLLRTARDRLELFGDVESARDAWNEAITRVQGLQGADFDALLQRLQAERDALTALSGRDRAAVVRALLGAARDLAEWPVRADHAASAASDAEIGATAESGLGARFAQVLDRLVKVERVDIEYLDPAQIDAGRESLVALLETLALSVARRDDAVAAVLAAAAERRVRRLLDPDDRPVHALLQRLGSLAEVPEPPDLRLDASASELRRLIEAGQ